MMGGVCVVLLADRPLDIIYVAQPAYYAAAILIIILNCIACNVVKVYGISIFLLAVVV